MIKKKPFYKILSLMLTFTLVLGTVCYGSVPAYAAEEALPVGTSGSGEPLGAGTSTDITADFTDTNFRAAVLTELGKDAGDKIYDTDVSGLSSLDVSNKNISNLGGIQHFIGLTQLNCSNNQLTTLDVRGLTSLTALFCHENQLTTLDVSGLTKLTCIFCNHNRLTAMNVEDLTALTDFFCYDNNMNSEAFIIGLNKGILTNFIFDPQNITAEFTDANFLAALRTELSKGAGDPIYNIEVSKVITLDVRSENISSLDGIQHFTSLEELFCSSNQLTTLDVSGLTNLTKLFCSSNQLTTLNVSGITSLRNLNCTFNQLTTLDVSGLTNLVTLHCYKNKLSTLNLKGLICLSDLDCSYNRLTTLDVSELTNMNSLGCYDNQLTSMNVQGLTALKTLECSYNNMKNDADITGLDKGITTSFTFEPQNASGFKSVTNITDLPSEASVGIPLTLTGTVFPSDATNQTIVWSVQDVGTTGATISGNTLFTTAAGDAYIRATITKGETALTNYTQSFNITVKAITGTDITADITDPNFDAAVRFKLGKDAGDPIYDTDVSELSSLDVSNKNIISLSGIEHFTGLTELNCQNNQLTSLDVSALTKLTELACFDNQLTSLDVNKLTGLTHLYCNSNQLTTLDVSGLSNMTILCCYENNLITLNLNGMTNLMGLDCNSNQLTTLDMSGLTNLTGLECSANQLTILDVSELTKLNVLYCSMNQLNILNVNGLANLSELFCYQNQLPTLNVFGLNALKTLNCRYNYMADESSIIGLDKVITTNFTFYPQKDFSTNTELKNLTVNGSSVSGFDTNTIIYNVELPYGTTSVSVGAVQEDAHASVVITQAQVLPGDATVVVTAEDKTTTKSYTIHFTLGVAPTTNHSIGDQNDGNGTASAIVYPDTTEVQPITKPNQPTIGSETVKAKKGTGTSATVEISEKTVANAIAKAQEEATEHKKTEIGIGVSLSVSSPTGTKSLGILLTQPTLTQLTKAVVSQLEIASSLGTLNFDLKAIKEIQKQSTGDVIINITPVTSLSGDGKNLIGTRPVYNISISYVKDGKSISITSMGSGSVTLSIPYIPSKTEAVGYLFGVYVDVLGNATRIEGSTYDSNSKSIIFDSNHFSVYGVGYKAPIENFTDISSHWAKESIDYVVGRGLLSSTSTTAFSPNGAMSSGMLVTALGRLAGVDISNYKTVSFTDVAADNEYAPYIEWAFKNGIVCSIGNNQFAPDRAITREEIALILSNYAKVTEYILPVTREAVAFADDYDIQNTYKEAVKAMQQAGIMMGGNGNKFNPKASTTRAEVSAILHRYIKLTINSATAQGWALNDAGQRLYYKEGKVLTGWQTIQSKKYFFDIDGVMQTGWKKDDKGNCYYLFINGALVGWQNIGSGDSKKRDYLTTDGFLTAILVSASIMIK